MLYSTTGNVSSSAATAARNPTTIPHPLLHHHHHHHQEVHHPIMIPLPPPTLPPFTPSAGDGGDDDDFPRRDERFPQWSNQETRDFIEIRAQLEWGFTTAKRNKNLWEMVANRMREKGYRRTADQCKCKWKNLVTRYRGQEASDGDNIRQCPFFKELHAVFTARANTMQQAQVDGETSAVTAVKGEKRLQNVSEDQSHKEFIEEQEDEEEIEVDEAGKGRVAPERKAGREKRQKIGEKENLLMLSVTNVNKNDIILNGVREMMRNFILQQQRIDMQWRESVEKHAEERELFEQEWRQKMEKLERERLMMEQSWREREEQRRLREESRAEKRDALLSTLLNKLIREESP